MMECLSVDLIRIIQGFLYGKDWVCSLLINKMWRVAPLDYKGDISRHRSHHLRTVMSKKYNLTFWNPDNHLRTAENKGKKDIPLLKHACVIGYAGTGKTVFLLHLADILTKRGYRVYYHTSTHRFDYGPQTHLYTYNVSECHFEQTVTGFDSWMEENDEKSSIAEYVIMDEFCEYPKERLERYMTDTTTGFNIYFIVSDFLFKNLPRIVRSYMSGFLFHTVPSHEQRIIHECYPFISGINLSKILARWNNYPYKVVFTCKEIDSIYWYSQSLMNDDFFRTH